MMLRHSQGHANHPTRPPPHAANMRIGLFGGSFNPPHEGHRLASLIAIKRLKLDRLWWLVTPGNPLKDNAGLPDMTQRMADAQKLANHPKIVVSGLEAQIGTRYTYDTIAWLVQKCPQVQFVWIMGADNLASFHRWQHWREITKLVPIAVIDRPGSTLKAAHARTARALERVRMDETDAPLLLDRPTPGFVFLHGPRSSQSSTALRKAGQGQ